MRQHPIPQNVLDVEFKLFTSFTLKEFAYLAIGVGLGGLFLYLTTRGQFPGIIGIPLFIIFSGLGVFIALVPINGQPADKFFSNFIFAINRPTQRVWLNKELKDERVKPLVPQAQQKKTKVFGGSKIEVKKEENDDQEDIGIGEITQDVEDTSKSQIVINEENVSKYQFTIKSVDKLPGNINLWVCNKENQPIPDIHTYLKSNDGKILYAKKTDKYGYFLTTKMYPEGIYNIQFEGVPITIPPVKLVLSKNMGKLPYKIIAI
jgi:hypothetical protein